MARRTRPSASALLAWAMLVALALCVFRPWQPTPFPIRDFGDLFTAFAAAEGPGDVFPELLRTYARDGRFVPLQFVAYEANWFAFGMSAMGWRLARFAVLVLIAGLAWHVLRRFGADHLGAWFGAALFIVSGAAAAMWTLPQVMEPSGVVLGLLAVVLALEFQENPSPWRALGMALSLVGAIWVKETFVVWIPFVLLIALLWRADGTFRLPLRRGPAAGLVGLVALGVLLCNAIPLIAIRAGAESSAYAARYGGDGITAAQLDNVIRAMLLPVTRVLRFPADAAFVSAVLLGMAVLARSRGWWPAVVLLVIGTLLPLTAAAVYAPWPSLPGYYAYASLFGLAILLALSVTAVRRSGHRTLGPVAIGLASVVIGLGAIVTVEAVSASRAVTIVEAAMLDALGRVPADVPLLIGTPDPERSGGLSAALRRGAKARGISGPRTGSDIPCNDIEAQLATGPRAVAVGVLPDLCPAPRSATPPPLARLAQNHRRVDWRRLRVRVDTAIAILWAPPPAGSRGANP